VEIRRARRFNDGIAIGLATANQSTSGGGMRYAAARRYPESERLEDETRTRGTPNSYS
jgi:hypothetical protein